MKRALILFVLFGLPCSVASASFVTVADWEFANGALTTDSSGNGYTLSSYNVTEGAGGTAVFNGSSQMWTPTGNTLDLTPYEQVRISFRMKTATEAVGILYEHGFVLNAGALIGTINETTTGEGIIGLNNLNQDRLYHSNYAWQDVVIQYDVTATNAADVVKIWIDGSLQADTTSPYGLKGVPSEGYSFLDAIMCIGARNGPSVGYNGELDYFKVEGYVVPEPATCSLLGFGSLLMLVRRLLSR